MAASSSPRLQDHPSQNRTRADGVQASRALCGVRGGVCELERLPSRKAARHLRGRHSRLPQPRPKGRRSTSSPCLRSPIKIKSSEGGSGGERHTGFSAYLEKLIGLIVRRNGIEACLALRLTHEGVENTRCKCCNGTRYSRQALQLVLVVNEQLQPVSVKKSASLRNEKYLTSITASRSSICTSPIMYASLTVENELERQRKDTMLQTYIQGLQT